MEIKKNIEAKEALYFSINHHLERKSVATKKEILATAVQTSVGTNDIKAIEHALEQALQNGIVLSHKKNGKTYLTSKVALEEEEKLITYAAKFKEKFEPINPNYNSPNTLLSVEQRQAIKNVLSTIDGISIIAGKAGTGKTYLMKEIEQGLLDAQKKIFAFAPTPEAAEVQRKDGFDTAKTIAELLNNSAIQQQTQGAIIWIDEAGMVCNKDMNGILEVAHNQNARLVLTGDTRQHAAIERGDALRILQQKSGYKTSPLTKIHRQKNEGYRQAVRFISDGAVEQGFAKLDELGVIHQFADESTRIDAIAADYLQSVSSFSPKSEKKRTKSVLIICLTYLEGDKVIKKVREQLKAANIIGQNDKTFVSLINIPFTEAEKRDIANYQIGHYVIFHQNLRGIKAGEKLEIMGTNGNSDILVKTRSGENHVIPISQAKNFKLFEAQQIHFAVGDKICITRNGKTLEHKNLFNGNVYFITGFDESGNIQLSNGYTLSKDFGHFTQGYVLTSYAAQGKSVDKVIIVYNSFPFQLALMEQFYVAVSRGKVNIAIYTDNKAELLRGVSLSAARVTAMSVVAGKNIG